MPSLPASCITLSAAQAPPPGLTGAVLVLGNFDGMHLGHRHVTDAALALAGEIARPALALTFEPHPRAFFQPDRPFFRLTPPAQKQELLLAAGLAGVVSLTFDAALAAMPAEEFVTNLLLRRLGAAGLVCGHDFHFGKGRTGSPDMLRRLGAVHHLPVKIVAPFAKDGAVISSSAIRAALAAGDVGAAAALLGRFWSVAGEVSHGDKRGRQLGYPTANMSLDPACGLRHGIYAVRMRVEGVVHDGVASFGRRPTFDDGAPRLETFLFDFSGDLYGRQVEVSLIGWLRGEEKFDSVAALVTQMKQDEAGARRLLLRLDQPRNDKKTGQVDVQG